jgi:hypothetical protein
MAYYVRVLSTSPDCVPLSSLRAVLNDHTLVEESSNQPNKPDLWSHLVLTHENGDEIAVIGRNPVKPGSLGQEALEELGDELAGCLPPSAAEWLTHYFPLVRCVYAFELLPGLDSNDGWKALTAVKNRIWSFAPAIIQADSEGFSNEQGYHILWQFRESVKGMWWMGVLQNGGWIHFEMDLANRKHREEFLQGMVPDGVKIA